MPLVDKGNCRIEYLNKDGIGIAKTAKGEIALPYTLKGELVSFEKHQYRGRENSFVTQIIEASPNREKPPCEYFTRCGGCRLQHLNIDTYQEFKLTNLRQALSNVASDLVLKDMIITQQEQRRRASFKIVKKRDRLLFGFYHYKSHDIVSIEHCLLLTPELSEAITYLKDIANQLLNPGDKAEMDVLIADNGIDVCLKVNNNVNELDLNSIEQISIIRLKVEHLNTIETKYQRQPPIILIDGHKIIVDAGSFMQPLVQSEKILSDIVLSYCHNIDENNFIADLFCGRGTFALPLSRKYKIDAFEIDLDAIKTLSATKTNILSYQRDLFNKPLNIDELNKYNVAVINPPRTGAIAQIKHLATSNVSRVIYVSCNPSSFALDAAELIKGGYILVSLTPVDQFIWSAHLEIVALFTKD